MSNDLARDTHGRRVARTAIACALAEGLGPVAVRAVHAAAGGDQRVLARAHLHCLASEGSDGLVRRRAADLILQARGGAAARPVLAERG